MPDATEYDCTRCGACCHLPDAHRVLDATDYVEVRPSDELSRNSKLVRRFVVLNDAGEPHMRMDGSLRCAALRGTLGRSAECVIYEERPAGCRRFEAGSDRCQQYRRERGVDSNADDGL